MKKLKWFVLMAGVALVGLTPVCSAVDASGKKKIVLVAGRASHGPGDHEFNAGVLLLKKCLDKVPGVVATAHLSGWPKETNAFDGADSILLFMDGGSSHPIIQENHLQIIGDLMKKGVGLACAHYGVEVPKDKGGPELLEWIGGYYESGFSTNPHWVAEIKSLPVHPITRGVKPFAVEDEWYYNMRFRPEMKGVTPILIAKPSDETRQGKSSSPRGPYSHIVAASGREEILAWAVERPDGGRGFGFTGAHNHENWGNNDFRKLVLNALVWAAKVEVPAGGIESTVTAAELTQNLDPKGGPKPAAPAPAAPTAGAPERGFGPTAAQTDLSKMDVGEGLEATVFASEPRVRNPTNMDIDARGRVWVTEGVNYRSSFQKWGTLQPEGDRIVILEDTDKDGRADTEKVFYQGKDINSALGICVLGNKVIVSCSPNVFIFTDTDGDDKADDKKVLFTGFTGVDHDHGVHAFVFGPDGKLYFNAGDQGRQVKHPDGTPVVDKAGNIVADKGLPYRKGMVFRCDMDGKNFETLGWNFRNNYEVAVDSFGSLWQSDNDDDGNQGVRINFVMEFGNYGYTDEITGAAWTVKRTNWENEIPLRHWHLNDPGVVPNLLQTGAGSPTGILLYEGNALPTAFQNQMIHCEPGKNVVRAYPVTSDGAGYKAEVVNILSSKDSWFRPSDVCAAPDGSIYIADWNDAGVGGHFMADSKIEMMRGRIYRIKSKGQNPETPKYDLSTAKGAVAALQSPNQATRYLAWTKLNQMQGKAEKELTKLWKDANPRFRARALHLLARIDGKESKYVQAAIKDKDADIRITGLRIARAEGIDIIPIVKTLSNDASPAVLRECLVALRHNKSAEMPKMWAQLAQKHDGKDRWYLEALGLAADRRENECFEAWLKLAGDKWNTAAGRDIIWRSRSSNSPEYLVKIITDKGTTSKEKPRYIRALDFIKGPEKEKALIDLLSSAN